MPVGGGSKGGEDDEDDGGDEKGVDARPFICQVAEKELADDGAGKGNRRDIFYG